MTIALRLCAAASFFLASSVAHAQQTAYAIGSGGATLLRFQTNNPSAVTVIGNFSGANTFLDAIDFRPGTGQLYGYLDSTDSFYTVDLNTGQLTLASVGASAAPTNTFQLGLDFNPTIDRARIVTDSHQNIVFNPTAGTVTAATNLFYATGDPNETATPSIIENAYSQNRAGGSTTQQYVIDYRLDSLVRLDNNTGILTTVGSLGVDTDIYTGFDIYTDAGGVDNAYAVFSGVNGAAPAFYSINLATGAATLTGALGATGQTYSLAVQIPTPSSTLLLVGPGILALVRRRPRS